MDVGIRTLAEQDINTLATSQQSQLGAVGVTADGRRYRYVKFGGTLTIAPGQLLLTPPVTANYQGRTITAVGTGGQVTANLSSGATSIVITNGSTAITQDQFAEGYLEVLVGSSGTSGSYSYKIKGNSAAAASATFTVYLSEPLRNTTALVPGTDTVNLNPSVYSAIAAPGTTNDVPAGVTVVPVPNTSSVTNYGWVQTGGPALVLSDTSAILVGSAVGISTTAGTVAIATAATAAFVGYAHAANGSASKAIPVLLNIN